MTNRPDDMPAWRHLDNAEILLANAEEVVARRLAGGSPEPTDALLAALTHAVIAVAKVIERSAPSDVRNDT